MENLQQAIDDVREMRKNLKGFPLPTLEQCMIYATTEAAEVRSAVLAVEAPNHVRRGNDHSPEMECIDAFIMLDAVVMQLSPDFEYDMVQFVTGEITPDRTAKAYLDYAGGGGLPDDLSDQETILEFMMFVAAWRNTFWMAAGNSAIILLETKLKILEDRVNAA